MLFPLRFSHFSSQLFLSYQLLIVKFCHCFKRIFEKIILFQDIINCRIYLLLLRLIR